MRTPSPYIPDPAKAKTPLTRPEVDAIINSGGRGFVRNGDAVMDFVQRTKLTMHIAQQQENHLRHVVEKQQRTTIAGSHNALNPMQAAKFLSAEQRESLFTGLKADALKRLKVHEQKLTSAVQKLTSRVAQIELILSTAEEEITPETAARLRTLLEDAEGDITAIAPLRPPPETPQVPPPAPHPPAVPHVAGNVTNADTDDHKELEDLWEVDR